MHRLLLLLLLALAAPSAHAQAVTRTEPPRSGLRATYDARLLATAEARDPLASSAAAEVPLELPRSARGSYWKAGAIVGGVLGGAIGGAGGFTLDNIERSGGARIGEFTFIGVAGGGLAGALLGAGVGALIGR